MSRLFKRAFLFLVTAAVLAAPLSLLMRGGPRQDDPIEVLTQYLRVLYARDFAQAYRFISARDRALKTSQQYVRERGAFHGVALEAARKLSSRIELRPLAQQPAGGQTRIQVSLKLPDANAISDLMLEWDEKRLAALSADEQRQILATIDELLRHGQVPTIEGEEDFALVQEGSRWKIFLNWAAGVPVTFTTAVPQGSGLTAAPLATETTARSGDLFTVGFRVKNDSAEEIVTRIVHRVEPHELAEHLDLVECALLLPVRLAPHEEQIFDSTYMVRGDLPEGVRGLAVSYEFKIEN